MSGKNGTAVATPLAWWIAAVLRVGTLAAVAVIATGYTWAFVSGQPRGGTLPLFEEVAGGGGDALTALGLLGLTVVPIFMLAAAVVGFVRAGERRMAVMASGVAVLLGASLVAAAVIGPAI